MSFNFMLYTLLANIVLFINSILIVRISDTNIVDGWVMAAGQCVSITTIFVSLVTIPTLTAFLFYYEN